MSLVLENMWDALLACREAVAAAEPEVRAWEFDLQDGGKWGFRASESAQGWRIEPTHLACDLESPCPPDLQALGLAGLYVRLLHGVHQARRAGKLFVTVHVAQSIDGRIATVTGDSQWIGNAANLVHAHRLRALHDGILVGANTVRRDAPRLTVRHCAGKNPIRVVLAGRQPLATDGFTDRKDGAPTWVLGPEPPSAQGPDVEWLPVASPSETQMLVVADVVRTLQARDMTSLMIEGGSSTISQFLAAGRVDELQIHVAPIILGSGIPTLQLPEIQRLREAPQFEAQTYDLAGERLYTLQPR